MTITCSWKTPFDNGEVNALHAAAFGHPLVEDDWRGLVARHSLGWATARRGSALVGFVNLPWDGLLHAWIQDLMVAPDARRQGVGTRLVSLARDSARAAGCEWLHADFDESLRPFYLGACGFTPTDAGLIALR
ncbi:MAG: GNAT family N-acetyltransferase [Actinobacteria bacterium]|nr:GNAT family N-acetyltransferase [Actinomycetota bacterium]